VTGAARPPVPLARIDHLGILVEDLDEAIAAYSQPFPVTKWRGYLYTPETVPELGYRGGLASSLSGSPCPTSSRRSS
jgi:hypothetical protein